LSGDGTYELALISTGGTTDDGFDTREGSQTPQLLVGYTGTTPPPPTEKVVNGNFELNPVNANSWSTINWGGTPTFTWATDFVHGGTHSAKINGTSMVAANFTQNNIAISGGNVVSLSAWLKTSSFTGTGVYFAVQELNSAGVEVAGTYWESTYKTGTNDWTQFTRTWTANASTTKIFIRAIANGTGTAWFDDYSISVP
jgi:hypothetical protein